MEIELHSTLGDSRDILRKQERLDRVSQFDFFLSYFPSSKEDSILRVQDC